MGGVSFPHSAGWQLVSTVISQYIGRTENPLPHTMDHYNHDYQQTDNLCLCVWPFWNSHLEAQYLKQQVLMF